jgi:hypothetical protein
VKIIVAGKVAQNMAPIATSTVGRTIMTIFTLPRSRRLGSA